LGSQNPQDNWNWGNNRAYLSAGDSIAPGQSKTFSFTITAPATPGTYNFQWRMLQEGIEWFGDYSQNRAISVESGSNCQVYDPSRAAYLEDSTLCADNQVCSNGICRYPEISYNHSLKAAVKLNGNLVQIPKPMYFTDVYMGAWNEYDLSQHPGYDLSSHVYMVPCNVSGPYYIGDYSSGNFGDPATVRRRLEIIKDAGLYPAIHLMSRHLIYKNGLNYQRQVWNDYGANVSGQMLYSYDLFNELYKPILEEMHLPYILVVDMWAFGYFVPDESIPKETFNVLYWQEMEDMFNHLDDISDGSTDMHIRIRDYSGNSGNDAYRKAVYLMTVNRDTTLCEEGGAGNIRVQFIKSAGLPGGTGTNPYNGHYIGLNKYFWIMWYSFTPDVRSCPTIGMTGTWNMANTNQITSFEEAQTQDQWTEGVDNIGPRYFYGYIVHINRGGEHAIVSGTQDETSFLNYHAREKGMVFSGVWNEYGEAIVMEPAVNTKNPDGTNRDSHLFWDNGVPIMLNNFVERKIGVNYLFAREDGQTCSADTQCQSALCSNGLCSGALCLDECMPSGSSLCWGTTGYRVCGYYDSDTCLEWSTVILCPSGQTCINGSASRRPLPRRRRPRGCPRLRRRRPRGCPRLRRRRPRGCPRLRRRPQHPTTQRRLDNLIPADS